MKKGTILGAYNCTYNKKTMYLYKCKSDVEGFMLKKRAWGDIVEDYGEIADILKENVKLEYIQTIKFKVNSEKKNYINKLRKRAGMR